MEGEQKMSRKEVEHMSEQTQPQSAICHQGENREETKVITMKIKNKGYKKLRKELKKIKKQAKQLNRALKKSAELRKKLF